MAILTEGIHNNEGLISQANGERSRELVTVKSGQKFGAMTVLGQITTGGKYVQCDPAATDGSEVAVAVSYAAVDATDADTPAVVYARDCELNAKIVQWKTGLSAGAIATATAELAVKGIILR